jgi:copper chaperone
MEQIFTVEGMSCGHCVKAVTKAVQQLDAQAQVQIDLSTRQVTIESSKPREALAKVIADEGYIVTA